MSADKRSYSDPLLPSPEEDLGYLLRDLAARTQQSDPFQLAVVASRLEEIDELVRSLDTQKPKRERCRRVPWLAYKNVNNHLPDLDLIGSIDRFIATACDYLESLKSPGAIHWYREEDFRRFSELVIAAKEGVLPERVRNADLKRLGKYCQGNIGQQFEAYMRRDGDSDWRIWVVAMFHEMWTRHRLQGETETTFLIMFLEQFIKNTLHREYVDQLRNAAPHEFPTLDALRETQRLRRDAERKRQKR